MPSKPQNEQEKHRPAFAEADTTCPRLNGYHNGSMPSNSRCEQESTDLHLLKQIVQERPKMSKCNHSNHENHQHDGQLEVCVQCSGKDLRGCQHESQAQDHAVPEPQVRPAVDHGEHIFMFPVMFSCFQHCVRAPLACIGHAKTADAHDDWLRHQDNACVTGPCDDLWPANVNRTSSM